MIQIQGIQVIAVILALLIFYEARHLYKIGKFKRRDFGIWTAVASSFVIVAAMPSGLEIILSTFTSLKRGLDIFLVLGLFGAFALIFQVYIRIQETNRQLTLLVRNVALRLEETADKK